MHLSVRHFAKLGSTVLFQIICERNNEIVGAESYIVGISDTSLALWCNIFRNVGLYTLHLLMAKINKKIKEVLYADKLLGIRGIGLKIRNIHDTCSSD